MAFAQAQYAPLATSGGGGGGNYGWGRMTYNQTTAWTAGGLSLAMTPVGTGLIANSVQVNYQEQLLVAGTDYTLSGNNVVIQFAGDPTVVGGTLTFQISYSYNA